MTSFFSWHKFRPLFGLYGAGGFGREILPIKGNFDCSDTSGTVIKNLKSCFIESDASLPFVNSIENFSEDKFLAQSAAKKYFNIAIANSVAREKIANNLKKNSILPANLISKKSNVHSDSFIGEGAIICAYATISANTHVGVFFHGNLYTYVAHDCIVGNFVTFAPGASCNGNVVIGDHAYIGANACIRQGTKDSPIRIGSHALIGMGAVITKSVPDYAVVVGNPGKITKYLNK
jgi:sugar O-acyltransferase (sialic acid O-acetyltransferase NeuD family)